MAEETDPSLPEGNSSIWFWGVTCLLIVDIFWGVKWIFCGAILESLAFLCDSFCGVESMLTVDFDVTISFFDDSWIFTSFL